MAYIQVDVDLDEFSTSDLLRELKRRVDSSDRMNDTNKQKFKDEVKRGLQGERVNVDTVFEPLPIETLDDKLKYEHLQSVWRKYNWSQLSEALTA